MIQFLITSRDIDYTGELKLSALCGFILDSAGNAATTLGFGLETVRKMGYSWVISSLGLEVYSRAILGETIYISTWIEKMNRLYSYRHFEVYNNKKELISAATSTWSLINFKERTLANIVAVLGKDAATGKGSSIQPATRITTILTNSTQQFTALYSDLDTNRHVNSISYIEWVFDSLPIESLKLIKRFDICYLREVFFGETIEVALDKQHNNLINFTINHQSDGKLSCSGTVTYSS